MFIGGLIGEIIMGFPSPGHIPKSWIKMMKMEVLLDKYHQLRGFPLTSLIG